nr:hypothetical protein [Tanacetum cinerariifolium]
WNGLLEDDCMRETFGCCKGPYDSSYAAPIFTEETLKGWWRYLVPAESHIHNCMLIPNSQDIKHQDFRYSDKLSNLGRENKSSKSKEKVVVSLDSEGSDADDFSELKKITALLKKAFNRRKFYCKSTNNNLRASSTSQSTYKKQEFVKTDNKKVKKKDDEKKRDMSRVKCYNCKKEGHFAKDCKKVKVKDYEYYKTKMFLAKKDKDKQFLLAKDQAWMESSSDSNQEINANMVFMDQIEKVLSDSEASSSSAD